jgi:hypothetical protein
VTLSYWQCVIRGSVRPVIGRRVHSKPQRGPLEVSHCAALHSVGFLASTTHSGRTTAKSGESRRLGHGFYGRHEFQPSHIGASGVNVAFCPNEPVNRGILPQPSTCTYGPPCTVTNAPFTGRDAERGRDASSTYHMTRSPLNDSNYLRTCDNPNTVSKLTKRKQGNVGTRLAWDLLSCCYTCNRVGVRWWVCVRESEAVQVRDVAVRG